MLRIDVTPARIAGIALRVGPHGDRFLPWSKGLNPGRLQAAEHGVALGPLEPGFRRRVFHPGRRLQLAPPVLLDEMDALAREIADTPPDQIVLIGRRDLRSNNSWMHNVPRLVAGKDRCVLFVHPADAARLDLAEGARVVLESRVHRGEVTVHVTDEVRQGVVSLPHGFGHRAIAAWQAVAGEHAGVSANDWVDDGEVEAIAGQSILNGVPVRLQRPS
jgi:anaerobic selenocysteine-containing dehydrogenase